MAPPPDTAWRGLAPGSRKDLGYFACGPAHANELVLCESAIDAISCAALYPDRLCLSTAGARPNPAWLPPLLAQHHRLYCGFDADPTGDRMAHAMTAIYPAIQRLRPPLHDWNDVLTASLPAASQAGNPRKNIWTSKSLFMTTQAMRAKPQAASGGHQERKPARSA